MFESLINRFKKRDPSDSPIEILDEDLRARVNDVEIKDSMQKLLDALPKVFNKRLRYMTTEYRAGFLDMYEIIQYFYKRQPKYNLNIALEDSKKKNFELYERCKEYAQIIDKSEDKVEKVKAEYEKINSAYLDRIRELEESLKNAETAKIPRDIVNEYNVWKTVTSSTMTDKDKVKFIKFYSKDWKFIK